MTALYLLAAEQRALADKLSNLDLDAQTIADTLEAESGALEEKATNVAFVVRNMESLAEQIKQAEATMSERRKAIEKRADGLREYLLTHLVGTGITKIDHPMLSIAIKGKAAAVEIFDEAQLPAEYVVAPLPVMPPPKPDKAAIGAALKAGKDVPGARLSKLVHRLELK